MYDIVLYYIVSYDMILYNIVIQYNIFSSLELKTHELFLSRFVCGLSGDLYVCSYERPCPLKGEMI